MNHPCGCSHPLVDDNTARALRKRVTTTLRGDVYRRITHPPDVFLLRTPARGDAFEFTVHVHITWCVEGREPVKRLKARLPSFGQDLEERLLRVVRPISRAHEPYKPQDAEEALFPAVHAELATAEYPFEDGSARARPGRLLVSPAKEVREIARTAWKRRQELVNGHELAELLKDHLGERRGWWDTFLNDGLDHWLTPYAVELAENPNLATEVVKQLRDDQREHISELAEKVEKQVRGYRESDDFATMLTNETVLRHLIKTIGLPVPPSGSPFGEPPDSAAVNGNGSGPSSP